MPKRFVEITSDFPELLLALVSAKQDPPYSIVKRESKYYLSFSDSADLRDTEKAKQSADVLLSNINGVLALLHPSRIANGLQRTNYIITEDKNGNVVGEGTREVPTTAALSIDFASMDFSSLLEMGEKASRNSRIKEAFHYCGQETSWFNLYDIYECIRKDRKEKKKKAIPSQWTKDSQGKDRLKDFIECANNAFISGYAARHSPADSTEINRISDTQVILKQGNVKIDVMTLNQAEEFIKNLMVQWLKDRGNHF